MICHLFSPFLLLSRALDNKSNNNLEPGERRVTIHTSSSPVSGTVLLWVLFPWWLVGSEQGKEDRALRSLLWVPHGAGFLCAFLSIQHLPLPCIQETTACLISCLMMFNLLQRVIVFGGSYNFFSYWQFGFCCYILKCADITVHGVWYSRFRSNIFD